MAIASEYIEEFLDRKARLVDDAAQRALGNVFATVVGNDGSASRVVGMLKDLVTTL